MKLLAACLILSLLAPAAMAESAAGLPKLTPDTKLQADFREQAKAFAGSEDDAFRFDGSTIPLTPYCNENALGDPSSIELYRVEGMADVHVLLCMGQLDGETNQVTLFGRGQPNFGLNVDPAASTYRLSPKQLAKTVATLAKVAEKDRSRR